MIPEDQQADEVALPDYDAPGQNGTHAVGYGRPPVEHRFKPGESGNRRGRPRRSQSTAEVFNVMFASTVIMTVDGKRRRLTVRQAMALRAKKEILTGNPRNVERWIPYSEKVEPRRQETGLQQQIDMDGLTDEQLRMLALIRISGGSAE